MNGIQAIKEREKYPNALLAAIQQLRQHRHKTGFLTKQALFVIATLSFVKVAFPLPPPGDKFLPAFSLKRRVPHTTIKPMGNFTAPICPQALA